MKIEDLPFLPHDSRTRIVNALRTHAGIETVDQLESKTDRELLRIPNIGYTSVKALRRAVAVHKGQNWSDPPPQKQNKILRFVFPKAHCAVRINLKDDSHVAWLARRWIDGEDQRAIAQSIGYDTPSHLNQIFKKFLLKHGKSCDLQYDGDRKRLLKQVIAECRL